LYFNFKELLEMKGTRDFRRLTIKMRFVYLATLTVVLMLLGVCSSAPAIRGELEGNYYIIASENTVTITGYRGTSKDVQIPQEIRGLPVTSIEESTFAINQLARVSIRQHTRVDSQAFDQMVSVTRR